MYNIRNRAPTRAYERCMRNNEFFKAITFYRLIYVNVTVIIIKQHRYGGIAQLGERYPYKVDVIGSSPIVSTTQE